MNSVLYDLAGASATATAAAWANRFDEPMTNRSKVYLGVSRGRSATGRGTTGGLSCSSSPVSSSGPTVTRMSSGLPATLARVVGSPLAVRVTVGPLGDTGDEDDWK